MNQKIPTLRQEPAETATAALSLRVVGAVAALLSTGRAVMAIQHLFGLGERVADFA